MENIKLAVVREVLTIEIDLSINLGRSKTGKSEIIASTYGNISIPDHPEIKLGLNLYKK